MNNTKNNMIALSHKTRFSHTVLLSTPERADTLFERAKSGDTLHSVGEYHSEQCAELMNQIGSNLATGKYTKL